MSQGRFIFASKTKAPNAATGDVNVGNVAIVAQRTLKIERMGG